MIRRSIFLALLLFIGGCYLPLDFEVDLNIDESGDFTYRYRDDIIAVTLLSKISRGQVKKAEIPAQAAIYKRDLARDSGFKKIDHVKFARFRVEFDRQGNIRREKTFDFVRSNARFLGMKRRKDGFIEVFGDRPRRRYVNELIERGIDARGILRIWTNAKVLKHNAPEVRPGSPALYQWRINSMRDTLPSLVLELQ